MTRKKKGKKMARKNKTSDLSNQSANKVETTKPEAESSLTDKESYDERESVYEQFDKSKLLPENSFEETETSTDNEDTIDNSIDKTETSPDAEEEYKKPEDEKEDKDIWPEGYVPYGAMHKERERRKSLQKELEDVKEQLHTVLQDYKSLNNKILDVDLDVDDEDYVTGKTVKQLRDENRALTERLNAIENEFTQTKAQTEESKLNKLITETDKSLSAEGFVGFSSFGADLVAKEINKIANEKGHEEAAVYQTPEGWKHLYKKVVYPQLKSFFSQQNKRETFEGKINAKKDANLVGSPGKMEKVNKKNEEWTYDDYLKMRNS